jgi:branched-chain amino acid transport system permease protein
MEILVAQIFNGLVMGSVYVLVALGLNLIFSITDIPDFAQGALYMVAAYAAYYAVTILHLPFILALIIAMGVGAAMAYLSNRLLYSRWTDAPRTQLLSAIALFFLIANVANWAFTSKAKLFPTYLPGTVEVMGYPLSYQRFVVLGAAALLFILVYLFIMKTKLGKAIRAASQDAEMAEVVGINIKQVTSVVFLMGGALSGAAGAVVAPLYSVYPSAGDLPLLKALVVVILGGFGSVAGVLICGIGLGVLEALGSIYISSAYQHGYAFFILILILWFRPLGLFGRV